MNMNHSDAKGLGDRGSRTLDFKDTQSWMKHFATTLKPKDVIWFEGPLGVGKTQSIKWILEAMGVDASRVQSPTYTYVNTHECQNGLRVCHWDFYRVEDLGVLDELGFHDAMASDDIHFIEWGSRFASWIPKRAICVNLALKPEDQRLISWGVNPEEI